MAGNVRHIFITKYFRDYIATHIALTPEGFRIYSDGISRAKSFVPCALPELSEHLPLTNLVRYRRDHALNSNTVATQHLLREGGIRIKLGARALWLLPSRDGILSDCRMTYDTLTDTTVIDAEMGEL